MVCERISTSIDVEIANYVRQNPRVTVADLIRIGFRTLSEHGEDDVLDWKGKKMNASEMRRRFTVYNTTIVDLNDKIKLLEDKLKWRQENAV